MGVKYVKDFSFPSSGGFHGDVQRYAKGGHVTKMPAKAKASAKGVPARAKPNAPAKGAPKMASKPAVGKRQGYNEGGRVPGREMDRLPTKRPPGRMKDLAPARRFKGDYQGYAEGGPVDEILPGDGRGGLEMAMPTKEVGRYSDEYDLPPDDFLRQLLQRDTERMRGDAAQQMRDLDRISRTGPGAPEPIGELMPLPEEPQYDIPPELRGPPKIVPASRAQRPIAAADRMAARRAAMTERAGMRQDMARPRGLGRAVMRARDKIAARAATPRMGIPKPVPAVMPVPEEPMYFKKGGEVKGKKIAKVMREYKAGKLHSGSKKGPKVTSEKQAMAIALSEARKAGAKIQKKAMGGSASAPREDFGRPMSPAFADARRAAMENRGMKRGRRFAEGGIFDNEGMAYESKGPKTRGTARKGREQGRRERRAREAMEHAEMYAPGKSLDMPDKKKHGGMPVHRRKPMYGNG